MLNPFLAFTNGVIVQFGDGTSRLPTKYAFGLVENRHDNLFQVTVRLQLRGEVKQLNVDDVEPCPRLLNMCSLISEESKSESKSKPLHILKVWLHYRDLSFTELCVVCLFLFLL